ncbi:hypothetical protein [Gracilibacillus salinarum]|uniref:Uncharacterized protein n=1 Tax=Gracilibacillus salinarum TaxID=2932255 RepID=A0ABY4GMY3_9BACI|nr:hypothetical protein [Gracilibacillus salinarum]UOQ85548.1 hypothetical protein MUN87_01185 [Gracilibacillus salinarum]
MKGKKANVCALNPIDCTRVKSAADSATSSASARYVFSVPHNGNGCIDKLMTNSIVSNEAKKFAEAHECRASGQPANEHYPVSVSEMLSGISIFQPPTI